MGKDTYFFLGANSGKGFYSFYDSFADTEGGDFIWLIKGGPGCGKSSFMRRIGKAAREAGLDAEYIRCSGDPDSLDGVFIPQKHLGYMDATAPHRMDCLLPAARDSYLDLGAFYDVDALRRHRTRLADLNQSYKAQYGHSYSLLAAAGNLDSSVLCSPAAEADRSAVRKRAAAAAQREFGRPTGKIGREMHRFISAISCRGLMRLEETATALCDRILALDDELGLADCYLQVLRCEAAARGLDAVICHDPLVPHKLEALLLPELRLGFIAKRPLFSNDENYDRSIRLDAMVPREQVLPIRKKLRAAGKLKAALLNEAVEALKEAKAMHDDIEAIYNPHVDFDGLYELCDRHIEMLLK